MIKILGGHAKGMPLKVPNSDYTRPTAVLLRRKLFDKYQDLSEIQFIDACAGSGAMGIEALSRGAKSVKFIESRFEAFKVCQKNILNFKQKYATFAKAQQIEVTNQKVETFLQRFKNQYLRLSLVDKQMTIFYFDPPYLQHTLYQFIYDFFYSGDDWYQGILAIESDILKGLPISKWDQSKISPFKYYFQGDHYIALFNLNFIT